MKIVESNLFWQEKYSVRSFELDREGRATFQTISNFLLDAAVNHAAALNLSVQHLQKMQLTWVLSRLHIRLLSYPQWRESITIQTWPSKVESNFTLRDFRVLDYAGQETGVATSSWMLIDFKTRKPVPMFDFLTGMENKKEGRALDDSFMRLPPLEKEEFTKHFHVRQSDLDINQHVNFINYIEWAIETVPRAIWQQYQLYDMQVSFQAESVFGDQIISQTQETKQSNNKRFIHRLQKDADQKELTRLVTVWVPKKS